MTNFEIITDGSAEFYEGYLEKYPVKTLPILIDEKGYHPVSLQSACKAMEEILDGGNDVLYIGMTSKISKSFQNVAYIAQGLRIKYPDRKIEFIDSLSSSCALGLMVYYAIKMKENGESIDDVTDFIENNKTKFKGIFVLDSPSECTFLGVNNTQKSGVEIIPVLEIDKEGKLGVLSKTISRKKAQIEMVKILTSNIDEKINDYIVVEYIGEKFEAEALAEKIRESVKGKDIKLIKANDFIAHQLASSGLGISFVAK